MSKLLLFTDGGSRGNPGPAAIGIYVVSEVGSVVWEHHHYLGQATNNEAEYHAFLASTVWLLEYLEQHPEFKEVVWRLDSKLVVEQLQKHWKIKEHRLLQIAQQIWGNLDQLKLSFTISHVPRELNKEADRLVNQALDAAGA